MWDELASFLFLVASFAGILFLVLVISACVLNCFETMQNGRTQNKEASPRDVSAYDDLPTSVKELKREVCRLRVQANSTKESCRQFQSSYQTERARNNELIQKLTRTNQQNQELTEAKIKLVHTVDQLEKELALLHDAGILYDEVIRQSGTRRSECPLLHHALHHRRIPCAQILIDGGSEIHSLDASQKTALHIAAWKNLQHVCRTLIEKGVEVNAADAMNRRPLHFAAQYNCVESLTVLIDSGAILDIRDHQRWTPLHLAYHYGCCEAAEVLVRRGAESQLMNADGQDAFDCLLQSRDITETRKAAIRSRMRDFLKFKPGASLRKRDPSTSHA